MLHQFENTGAEAECVTALTMPLRWVPTEIQLAGGLAKVCRGDALKNLMSTGRLQLPLVDTRQKWKELVAQAGERLEVYLNAFDTKEKF